MIQLYKVLINPANILSIIFHFYLYFSKYFHIFVYLYIALAVFSFQMFSLYFKKANKKEYSMIAVIGDIHGCYSTFSTLHKTITKKYPNISVYCTGDVVDRGKFSYECFEYTIHNNIKTIMGNHEYMFHAYFNKPGSLHAQSWLYNGCFSTLDSYKNIKGNINKHMQIIEKLPYFYSTEDAFISHAGISERYSYTLVINNKFLKELIEPVIKSHIDMSSGILWNRDKLLNIETLQIVGHTRQKNIKFDTESNAVYIDTGACGGNKLSAVIVEKNNVIDILDEATHEEDIN